MVTLNTQENTAQPVTPVAFVGPYPHAFQVGQPFAWRPQVSGGSGTKTFAVSGPLPGGLTHEPSTGEIAGTPLNPLPVRVTHTVTDSSGSDQRVIYLGTVRQAPPLAFSTTVPLTRYDGQSLENAYGQPLTGAR